MKKGEASKALLIVEDNRDLRALVKEIMESHALKVFDATNGVEALTFIQSRRFDAVVTDVQMPGMDGFRLISKTRELGYEMPFIFLSGRGNSRQLVEILKTMAFDYLEKPFNPDLLSHKIWQAINYGSAVNSNRLPFLDSQSGLEVGR